MAFPGPDSLTVLIDLVEDSTNSTGATNPLVLNGANVQRRGADAIGNGNNAYWRVDSGNNVDWEIFKGTVTLGSPNLLSIDTVYLSTNSNTQISLTGKSQIRLVSPADLQQLLVTYYASIILAAHTQFGGL